MAEPATSLRVSREYGETMPMEMLAGADSIRTDTYFRKISDDERVAYGEEVVSLSATVEDKQEEKKQTVKMFQEDIKHATTKRREILKIMKSGEVEVLGGVHTFYDFDNLKVHEYNERGERIATRRMRPDERQLQLPTA